MHTSANLLNHNLMEWPPRKTGGGQGNHLDLFSSLLNVEIIAVSHLLVFTVLTLSLIRLLRMSSNLLGMPGHRL